MVFFDRLRVLEMLSAISNPSPVAPQTSSIFMALQQTILLLMIAPRMTASSRAPLDLTGRKSGYYLEETITQQEHKRSTVNTTSNGLDCGLWVAPSTLPGAGIGMFAGQDFIENQLLEQFGDIVVPIIDFGYHQAQHDVNFLWNEYTWDLDFAQPFLHGYGKVDIAGSGLCGIPNCFFALQNIEALDPHLLPLGFHRSKDPGTGAFSQLGNRTVYATRNIQPGEELFLSYGEDYFVAREHLRTVPLTDDLRHASKLFDTFKKMRNEIPRVSSEILSDLWATFIQNTSFRSSRVLGAFNHHDPAELQALEDMSMTQLRMEQSSRSKDWLQKYGTCADHIRVGRSTIDQAGHGAFASRSLPAGTVVAPLPLVHIPDRQVLEMYHFNEPENHAIPLPHPDNGISGYQLLLNYCMGHRSSTLLLCTFGPVVNYVNHNKTLSNVKLQWADPSRGKHDAEVLNYTLERLELLQSCKLAMELVATRDIEEGDEVFLDYGTEWEDAWSQHVANWEPIEETYNSAYKLNQDLTRPLRLESESEEDPFVNVGLSCSQAFIGGDWGTYFKGNGLQQFSTLSEAPIFFRCELLRRNQKEDGTYCYTAEVWYRDEAENNMEEVNIGILLDAPRDAFSYYDQPYTTDTFIEGAFRHDMRIPDELFPDAWKNLEDT